ncbi:DNA-binding MarR family transcriptional regulator [Clostridium acetobutylicum]|uniref:Transcriptional regulator, MarR/EmrR family n=1 Tax=Clostridium acetobutylicum (strain ATCC 824 / DSM 792 / JCM 1419 / IAM 19013 / LMG 5710 / NBRC 13948 / NRRL B-527 / VKM B-1787 / 2291 / W) TaxID=272562 RepID=Q97LD5_CLOAB|nr:MULTISPECIES: MarR family winged helix-turn-helix transcriptional regulator [Clostridium]AAK78604.1 Transcriptional regulator, MarR/EmrR family [Clostridium acetobutylicum ATCC 824]AEI31345.1 MarR family transcriptional regulator [Clostridium acetobutylicum DSM 1731]AWV80328.1 MarR family transcriptional regulator [Clostridium acetobutylicum]MBC2392514.1 winged helix-turn-helix transcriptional regulator [Clostridium acetobutylicum]MBC2583808.1 winged helix-turn-helix transcriptional regulat
MISQNKFCIINVLQKMLDKLRMIEIKRAEELEISVVQVHAIFEIGKLREVSTNEFSKILYLDKNTVNKIVNNLVDEKFVLRHIHPENTRHVILKLTENGQKIYENIRDDFKLYCKRILDNLPEKSRESITKDFEILLKSMEDNA